MAKSLYDYCVERDDFVLLVQWDKERNGEVHPKNVRYGSHKKIWWKCGADHLWQAPVYSRTTSGSRCPYCTGRKIMPDTRSLAVEHPELSKQWHPSKNGALTPNDVMSGSHRKVWWRCDNGHEWQAQIKARATGSRCPYCSNRKVIVGENDLATTNPELAAQWHPTKNGSLTPQMVVAGNHRKVWWQCDKGHEWQATLLSRSFNHVGCPVCAGKIVIPGENDLASQFPQIAAQWHPLKNGSLKSSDVTAYSNRRAWWVCEKGHEYPGIIAHRARNTSGCPYCTNRKVLAGFNDLETIHPKIAAQWHPTLNGSLTPQMVTSGSHQKVWWQCADGHIWKAVVYSRTGPKKCGCPVCSGKVKESKQIRYDGVMAERLKTK